MSKTLKTKDMVNILTGLDEIVYKNMNEMYRILETQYDKISKPQYDSLAAMKRRLKEIKNVHKVEITRDKKLQTIEVTITGNPNKKKVANVIYEHGPIGVLTKGNVKKKVGKLGHRVEIRFNIVAKSNIGEWLNKAMSKLKRWIKC